MRTYTVKSGDTLSKIARKLEVPLDAIIRMNGIANPDRIRVGQELRVPEITTDLMDAAAAPLDSPPDRPASTGAPRINRSRYRLPAKEYYPAVTKKDLIVLHFTAGKTAGSAYRTWAENPNHVATAYIVDPNGTIYETFDPAHWAYHLGVKNTSGRHDKRSIGIEIANAGPLKVDPRRPDRLNWWPSDWGTRYCERDETDKYVEASYREIDFFAAMPDSQQRSVGQLVRYLCDQFEIKQQIAGAARRAEFDKDYFFGFKGVAAHQNFRKDKWDAGPAFDWDRLGL